MRAAALLLVVSLAGCTTIDHRTSFLHRVPVDGKRVVVVVTPNPRFSDVSVALAYELQKDLQANGMQVILWQPPAISLADHPELLFAREQQADLVFIYGFTGGAIQEYHAHDPLNPSKQLMGVTGTQDTLKNFRAEGKLFDLKEDRVTWRVRVDYDDANPLPGSFGRCGQRMGERVVGALIEDGFLRKK